MTVYENRVKVEEGHCPLLTNLPCFRGKERAVECCLRVFGEFDPVSFVSDLQILECATHRAKQMHEAAIKHYY